MGIKALIDEGPRERTSGTCKTCRWLGRLDPAMATLAEAIIAASDEHGEWLYSHKQLAREFADDGLDASDTAITNHREAHVAR